MISGLPKGPPLGLPGPRGKKAQKTKKKKHEFFPENSFFFFFFFFRFFAPGPGVAQWGTIGEAENKGCQYL